MEDQALHEFETKLLARRNELLALRSSMRSTWQRLSERESEPEESAAKENISRDLERFDQRGSQELMRIDDALARIEKGEYGLCAVCGEPISTKRLQVLPWARECLECAEQRELFAAGEPFSMAEQIAEDELNDDEIVEAIWNELERAEGVEKEGLRISCRDGIVTLSGTLPDSGHHQKLMEIIHDELGIDDVIDRIEIGATVYEEHIDTDIRSGMDPEDKQTAMDGEKGQSDVHTAMADNEPLVPPDEFVEDLGKK